MRIIEWHRTALRTKSAVTWGFFDGVHLGHQKLLKKLSALARSVDASPVVVTFRNHPAEVLYGASVRKITSLEEKLELFAVCGAEVCAIIRFTRSFAMTPGDRFIRELKSRLNAAAILFGYDSRFGYMRRYGRREIGSVCRELGIRTASCNAITINGITVSSRRIRRLLETARLEEANSMLGRAYSVRGTVIRGRGLGRGLGFPTANIKPDKELIIPYGVYKTRCEVHGRSYSSVTHYGARPTLSLARPGVECHLLNFRRRDLYGAPVRVEFFRRIRGVKKFSSMESLGKQIAKDAAAAQLR